MKLCEICNINMGQSPDSSLYNEEQIGMPFYQGNADFGEIHPKARMWCTKPTKIAKSGDILISVRAPIGALNIANEDCCIGRGLAAITADSKKCSKKYIKIGTKELCESKVPYAKYLLFRRIKYIYYLLCKIVVVGIEFNPIFSDCRLS